MSQKNFKRWRKSGRQAAQIAFDQSYEILRSNAVNELSRQGLLRRLCNASKIILKIKIHKEIKDGE